MRLIAHRDAADFLRDVQPELERSEAENSLVLGAALALAAGGAPAAPPPYLAVAREGEELAGAALRAPPFPLLLVCDPARGERALPLLLSDAARRAGSVGSALVAERFVEAARRSWASVTGREARPRMGQRLHALDELLPVPRPPGRLRAAAERDLELVAEWMWCFEREAHLGGDRAHVREAAARRVGAGELFLWEDPEPRTMAGRARPTRGTVAVNAVYTPPEHRGRGYATGCVAELSRLLLGQFRQCVLFTDLANPTSNAIYARIGYRPVLDFVLLDLAAEDPRHPPGAGA